MEKQMHAIDVYKNDSCKRTVELCR